MKKLTFFLIIIVVIIAGCTEQEIKADQVYVVGEDKLSEEQPEDELKIEGRIPFQEYVNLRQMVYDDPRRIMLTISPSGNEIFLMEKIETDSISPVIKGEPGERVRIIKEDIAAKDENIIIEDIPFVSRVLWNSKGNMVAFGGGGRLTIYDVENGTTLMEEKLAGDAITYFFWSPKDEKKLYSEQPNVANGSIYYVASQKKVEAYETREETYYKGKLEGAYYYGTKWDLANDDINTVILDKQGKVIKVITRGSFRDAYQRSLVVVGENGFGLNYIKDINSSEKVMNLTDDLVYDVKFVADGKIAYTTTSENVETNSFHLFLVSNNGRQLEKFTVSGGSIAVSPDGKFGYISGPGWQQVDFAQNILVKDVIGVGVGEEDSIELQSIYTTIRGAITTIFDYELRGEQNWSGLKKYFKNSHSPEQWAYFDMEMIFQDSANLISKEGQSPYMMKIDLKSYDINHTDDVASVIIGVETKTWFGKGVAINYALELIKSQGDWYVTGFSTFPHSKEREEIEELVQEAVANIQMGKLFPGELADTDIIIGQIQFWRSGMPHLSPTIESATAVKAYLQVNNQGKEEIYKLVFEKVNQGYWKPAKLSKENLSSL